MANAYHEDSCSAPHCLSHQKFTMTIFDQVEKITKCRIFRLTCGLWIMTICYLYKVISKGHKILMRRKAFHCCKVPCMKVIVFSQTRNYITWNHQIAYTCIYSYRLVHITHELYGNRFSAVKTYDLLWYQWDTYFHWCIMWKQ